MIKDSGERREFGSGSVRDTAIGKGRCDLLPWGVIAQAYAHEPQIYEICLNIDSYIRKGKRESLNKILNVFAKYQFRNLANQFLEVSVHYEDGAKKYDERNWEKGQPLHVYIDSGGRHFLEFLRGDNDEAHDRAFIWNIMGAMWTHENLPEMIDLPFKEPTTWEGDPKDFWEYESTLQKVCADGVCSLEKV